MSSSYRSILAANLRHFERNLESVNDQKRSNYERRHSTYEERHETQSRDDGDSMSGGTKKAIKTGGFTAGGAAVGGVIAGPPGKTVIAIALAIRTEEIIRQFRDYLLISFDLIITMF